MCVCIQSSSGLQASTGFTAVRVPILAAVARNLNFAATADASTRYVLLLSIYFFPSTFFPFFFLFIK